MPQRLAIFDFDGTLADSFPWFSAQLNQMARRHGFRQVQAEEEAQLRALGAREIMASLGISSWQLPRLAWDMRRRMAQDLGRIRCFEGVPEAWAQLHERGVAIAVLTSNGEANVRQVLGAPTADLVGHFACGASLFGKAAKLRRLLKASGLPPERVLCVGDELRDLEAAREVGLPFGAVAWGYTLPQALEAAGPDFLFRSPNEWVAWADGPGA